jgi:hypothetical protein
LNVDKWRKEDADVEWWMNEEDGVLKLRVLTLTLK